jgi:LruC domain-containing protein
VTIAASSWISGPSHRENPPKRLSGARLVFHNCKKSPLQQSAGMMQTPGRFRTALQMAQATFGVQAVGGNYAGGPAQSLTPSTADSELTLVLSNNVRALFGGAAGQLNSLTTTPRLVGQSMVLDLTFSTPVNLSSASAPDDVYIFRTANPGHEIHGPGFSGTANMLQSLSGTGDDGSTNGRWFVDQQGLPFALALPLVTDYPKEGVSISALYPAIVDFAVSGGASPITVTTSPVSTRAAAARRVAHFATSPPALRVTTIASAAKSMRATRPITGSGSTSMIRPALLQIPLREYSSVTGQVETCRPPHDRRLLRLVTPRSQSSRDG